MSKKSWNELTKDELLAKIEQCNQYLAMSEGFLFGEASSRVNAVYEAAKKELTDRFDVAEEDIPQETQKWVKEQYRKNYEKSYCPKCHANPGFDKLIEGVDTPPECKTTLFLRRIYHGFPEKKQDCLFASKFERLDDKCK